MRREVGTAREMSRRQPAAAAAGLCQDSDTAADGREGRKGQNDRNGAFSGGGEGMAARAARRRARAGATRSPRPLRALADGREDVVAPFHPTPPTPPPFFLSAPAPPCARVHRSGGRGREEGRERG